MKQHIALKQLRWLLALFVLTTSQLYSQTSGSLDSSILDRLYTLEQQVNYTKPGNDHFMMVGLTTFGFAASNNTNTLNGVGSTSKNSSFPDADNFEFSPMF
jgi:hypothetical protein